MRRKWIYTAVVLLLAGAACTGCNVDQTVNDALDGVGNVTSSREEQKYRNVYDDVKEILKGQIQTPTSAVFPTYGSDGMSISADSEAKRCVVTGYFDADNLMGATVRAQYSVEIVYTNVIGSGEYRYTILSLE